MLFLCLIAPSQAFDIPRKSFTLDQLEEARQLAIEKEKPISILIAQKNRKTS